MNRLCFELMVQGNDLVKNSENMLQRKILRIVIFLLIIKRESGGGSPSLDVFAKRLEKIKKS